ncbi:hypothetical protein Sipo8835_32645 [Streptomyces ipomoeae]|uniref:Uncharacterized protein n=1 Tax=Streptomyces ipomoeae TaxID=103232 RepID=A0AAE9AY46_9ACTN|nr:hypothetical protein [Streptomyces ipomoeae]TQE24864.1 hypothetical protein Sipo8835_32645 [Streptomyces ipomoeae]
MSTQPKMPLDFSKIRGDKFNPIPKPEGEYLGVITSFEDTRTRSGAPMWVFGVTLRQDPSAVYPVYCLLGPDQIWKLRNLLLAVGLKVPRERVSVEGGRLIGKELGVCLEEEDFEGRKKSVIGQVFPASEYEGSDGDADEVCTTPSDFQTVALDLLRRLVGGGSHGPEGIEALTMALSGHGLDPDNAVGPAINNLASSVSEAGDKIRGGLDNIARAIGGTAECHRCHKTLRAADLAAADDLGYRPGIPLCKPCAVKEAESLVDGAEWARQVRARRAKRDEG